MRTIENADKAIVLNEEKVVEEGSPQELIKQKGQFTKMVSLQKESANFNIKFIINKKLAPRFWAGWLFKQSIDNNTYINLGFFEMKIYIQ